MNKAMQDLKVERESTKKSPNLGESKCKTQRQALQQNARDGRKILRHLRQDIRNVYFGQRKC